MADTFASWLHKGDPRDEVIGLFMDYETFGEHQWRETGIFDFVAELPEAVLAHEVSHIANGDMVTLTLIQGVLNTVVVFLSRILGRIVDRAVFNNRDGGYGIGYFMITILFQVVLGFFASMIVMWFSRRREFRADSGGASLTSNAAMAAALERLQLAHAAPPQAELPEQMAAMGIRGGKPTGIRALLMSHPPLEDRIAALRAA